MIEYRFYVRLSLFTLCLFLLASCFPTGQKKDIPSSKLKVVTTVGMVAEIIQSLCSTECEHTQLIAAGIDPHLYQSTSGDVQKISEADVIFFVGINLEGKLSHVLETQKKAVSLGHFLPKEALITVGPNTYDPHVWLDVGLWTNTIEAVEQKLTEKLPASRMDIRNRATELRRKWIQLDSWVREQVRTLSDRQRVLITSHNSFQYFAKAYGFKVLALQGVSTQSEASLSDIIRVTDYIKAHKIPAIFAEATISRQAMEKVAQNSGAQVATQELFTDSLSPPDGPAPDYEGLIRHNVSLIVSHLNPKDTGKRK